MIHNCPIYYLPSLISTVFAEHGKGNFTFSVDAANTNLIFVTVDKTKGNAETFMARLKEVSKKVERP